jgi:hypothetical protein
MTARTQVWLFTALAAGLSVSIVLWCLVVFVWKVPLVCLFAPCDADVRVSGQLSVEEEVLQCHIQLVAPKSGSIAVDPVFGESDIGRRFDTSLRANPHRSIYQVFVSCPGGRTYTSPEFSLRDLAATILDAARITGIILPGQSLLSSSATSDRGNAMLLLSEAERTVRGAFPEWYPAQKGFSFGMWRG